MGSDDMLELLVVGAGPTGIAIGTEAKRQGIRAALLDKGPVVANVQDFPTFMRFFTTTDRLEIAGVPFAIPDEKPDRQQAIVYYMSIVRALGLDVRTHHEVTKALLQDGAFEVSVRGGGQEGAIQARAVAIATGYFHLPNLLGVEGEHVDWVHSRYREPYRHFGERVVVVGGGNSAAEAALDLWRNGARVTLVHRGASLKGSVKYWLRPDFEHRVAEGSIVARYDTKVLAFGDRQLVLEDGAGTRMQIGADAVYVLIGYRPDVDLLRACGVELEPESLIPKVDPESCESNVPGLYVAGTLLAGRATDKIFIENSREHAPRIVSHLAGRLGKT